jgi:hypothetical protein
MSKTTSKLVVRSTKTGRFVAPPGMLVTKSGRFIAKPPPGRIPVGKIRAAIKKLPRSQEN